MYTPPQLTRIGDARDVVLGQSFQGLDLDETHTIGHFEYAEDIPVQVNGD